MKHPEKIKDLFLKHKAKELVFLDVGARGKLDCVDALASITEMHAFEPDPTAFAELEKTYKQNGFKKLHLNQLALSDKKDELTLFVSEQASMSSLLEPDMENYQKHFGGYKEFGSWKKRMNIDKRIALKTDTLDSYFETFKNNIDFLKIDTQGTELSILKGANHLLEQKKISVIKLEVTTIPVYKNQVLFSEIDIFLRSLNYTLVDFITYHEEYTPAFEKIIIPRHSGPCGDAIYVLNNEAEDKTIVLKKSLVLMWLGYTSLALALLSKQNIAPAEQNLLLHAFQPGAKKRIKTLLKNITPPFIWQVVRNIKHR